MMNFVCFCYISFFKCKKIYDFFSVALLSTKREQHKPGFGRHTGDILFSNLVGRLKRIKAKSWVLESGLNSGCKTIDSTLIFTDEMSNVHRSYSPKDTFISCAVALCKEY